MPRHLWRTMLTMRTVLGPLLLVIAATAGACARDEGRPASTPASTVVAPRTSEPSGRSQYLVADPSPRASALAVPLPSGGYGLIVDKTRIVVGRGEARVAPELVDRPLAGAARIPSRWGGGFLFWTEYAIYRSDAFDGPLRPVARVPESIEAMSFAPAFLLVRTHNGERWALRLPSGERAAIEPLGVLDVEALDDGRALAFTDLGTVLASLDGGVHWSDVTVQARAHPSRVASVDGELWLVEPGIGASRLEVDGHLVAFDREPSEPAVELRPKDPRWRGSDPPLRAVFHDGAALDETTGVVVEQGDLVYVDLLRGSIAGVVSGRLPPDAHCQAVPTSREILFACVGKSGQAFVASHRLSGEPPVIEQTFAGGAHFFASDDGGLAYAGPCSVGVPGHEVVCVRQPGGAWQELDVAGPSGDAGANDMQVVRWIPRADGRAVALVAEPSLGLYDPTTATFQVLAPEGRDAVSEEPLAHGRLRKKMGLSHLDTGVDRGWSFVGGALRGWSKHGGGVQIAEDGRVTRSPFTFEVVSLAAGASALGRTHDGRLFQSTDHGATWAEVDRPPSGAAFDLRGCTSAGCDLGGFYRVGWAARAPHVTADPTAAPPAPEPRRTPALEIACRPAGPPSIKVLPRTGSSPEDLGLGASRLPVQGEHNDVTFIRNFVQRGVNYALMGLTGDSDSAGMRGLLSGPQFSLDDASGAGGQRRLAAFRRSLAYVPAFDPLAPVRRVTMAMSDVVAAGRAAGMPLDDIVSDDMTESGSLVVATSSDPAAAGEVVFSNARGLLAVVRAPDRRALGDVRFSVRPPQNDASIVSAVALPGDETAMLEFESSAVGHVFKVGPAGVSDLFDVSTSLSAVGTPFSPANPDALAVGPRGELAIVRTSSGSDPASALDPAVLLVPGAPPVRLAPWSELRLADDPACKADPAGFRATLQLIAPWMRVTTAELRGEPGPMLARVRWNERRVCLEGVEVKLAPVNVRASGASGAEPVTVPTWLVARGGTFARIAVEEGIEWRQPLDCQLGAAQAVAAKP